MTLRWPEHTFSGALSGTVGGELMNRITVFTCIFTDMDRCINNLWSGRQPASNVFRNSISHEIGPHYCLFQIITKEKAKRTERFGDFYLSDDELEKWH